MLLSHRVVHSTTLGASIETRALVHTRYRLHLVQNTGVVCEDLLAQRAFERKGALGRPVLTVVLAGRARLSVDGAPARWLEAGGVALFPSKSSIVMRQEGERFASIALEWDPDTLGPRPSLSFGQLDPRARARLAQLAEGFATDGTLDLPATTTRFATLLAALRAQGVPLAQVDRDVLLEPVPETTVRLSRTLDRLLSRLDDRPMAVDLDHELGLSARQVTRVVTAFNTRYGFNAEGWRDALNRRRIMAGVALMSAAGATTERVSAQLGYSSPTAFCRALGEAGLPAPGSVARAVASLR